MTNKHWLSARTALDLQLFAGDGGGAGGDGGGTAGAATGEGTAGAETHDGTDAEVAAQQRLRELGVPENVLKRRARRAASKPAAAVTTAEEQGSEPPAEGQVAAADATPKKEETRTDTGTAGRMSWKEIMNDPEYNREMQLVVQSRLKTAKGAEENLAKLTPALELLARKYQLDPANIDHKALADAISRDATYYEARALEMGVPVETAMKVDQQERDSARETRTQQDALKEEMHRAHIAKLFEQGEALKKIFPDFDLRRELQNPAFARMTAPGKGLMSVEDAYRAVHRAALEKAAHEETVRRTTEQITASIRAGTHRPDEAGADGQSPSSPKFDYRNASPAEREAFKKKIRDAAAVGQKIYPGGR